MCGRSFQLSKPKTQAQLDRETDKRLLKKYGVDLYWYEYQLEDQGGGCLLCGSTEKTRRLHVDHDHSYTKVKIKTEKITDSVWKGWWTASAIYRGRNYSVLDPKRNAAIQQIKEYLKRDSVRGLLCFRCNKFIVGFGGPEILRRAADYLEAHQRSFR